jgi:C1A family cysteine protease
MYTTHFDYLAWMAKYNRQVSDVQEFMTRLENFSLMHNFIEEHNSKGLSWIAGHNQFSDWSSVEYKAMLGYVPSRAERKAATWFQETNEETINWVNKGAVTKVKDQAACGSCWAFSSTGSLEGAHFVATGELKSFSEQQLVSCAGYAYGNLGCNGGLQSNAYNYYKAGHGAMLEEDYPYTSGNGSMSSCKYSEAQATDITVSSYENVTPNNAEQMKAALNTAPLAVAIEADKRVFQSYKSGVLTDAACGQNLDHAVLAVGYGTTDDGQDYWLIKNSWNTTWGDEGYIKLGMDSTSGTCGVQQDPQLPTTN